MLTRGRVNACPLRVGTSLVRPYAVPVGPNRYVVRVSNIRQFAVIAKARKAQDGVLARPGPLDEGARLVSARPYCGFPQDGLRKAKSWSDYFAIRSRNAWAFS